MKYRFLLALAGSLLLASPALTAQVTTIRSFATQEFAASSPVQGTDGAWYGVLYGGGANSAGGVYRTTTAGAYTLLYSFTGGSDGANPVASLSIGSDGNFYGTTSAGGANGTGTLFSITSGTSGTFTSLYSFPATSGSTGVSGTNTTGASPYSSIIQDASGNWWGTTSAGGANGWGTVFEYSGGTATAQHAFTGVDGQQPFSGLVQDSNNYFYGVTTYGGNGYDTGAGDGCGTVYRVTPAGSFALLYSFKNNGTDGCNPVTGLTQPSASALTLYGTTAAGGANGTGSVFSLTPTTLAYAQLSSFTLANIAPGMGSLLVAGDGNIYGTTLGTGICNYVPGGCGNAVGPYAWLRSTKLAHPQPRSGGMDTDGSIYRIAPGGAISNVYSFSGAPGGATPITAPFEGSDGNLYGTTIGGGANNAGILYQYAAGLTPLVTVTAPASVTAGVPFNVSWSIVNAASATSSLCNALGGWSGQKTGSGSQSVTVTIDEPTTFALVCGGTATGYAVSLPSGCTTNQICFSSLGHNFGAVAEGSNALYGVQVSNTYTSQAYPISVSLSGSSAFSQTNNCPASLAAGAKCEIIFSYTAPSSPGYQSTTINISPGSGYNFNPSNTGILRGQSVVGGSITVNTFKHNYGGVVIGNSQFFGWLISNGTGVTQAVSFTPNGDTTDISAVNTCGSSIKAGATCSINFTYTPSSPTNAQLLYTINTSATVTFDGTTGNTLTLIGYGKTQ